MRAGGFPQVTPQPPHFGMSLDFILFMCGPSFLDHENFMIYPLCLFLSVLALGRNVYLPASLLFTSFSG